MSKQSLSPLAPKRDVKHLSTEELLKELASLLGITAENMMRLALVVVELEGRGEDLTGLRRGFISVLRNIACGKLLPEIAIQFAGHPIGTILNLADVPVDEQKRILEKKEIPQEYRSKKSLNYPSNRRGNFFKDNEGGEFQGIPELVKMAEAGSPADVADIVSKMILASSDPEFCLALTVEKVKDRKRQRKMRNGDS